MTTETPPPPAGQPAAWTPPPVQAGPAEGLRYGGFWVRFVAIFLDGIVLAVITSALSIFALGGTMFVSTTEAGAFTVNYTYNALSAPTVTALSVAARPNTFHLDFSGRSDAGRALKRWPRRSSTSANTALVRTSL